MVTDIFPKELLERCLGADTDWRQDDALKAIDVLEQKEFPVVGVEHMRQEGTKARVLDYSTYDGELGDISKVPVSERPSLVKKFCDRAREYIIARQPTEDEFFILTWLEPEDMK